MNRRAASPGRPLRTGEEFIELAYDLKPRFITGSIDIHLDAVVDAAVIEAETDHVILATGAAPMTPPIPGVEQPLMWFRPDVLEDRVYTGKRVVIVGGGAETALFLAEKGTLSADVLKFLFVNKAETPKCSMKWPPGAPRKLPLLK
ncbi:MAG: FAD-dependent oxidoreductase [Desulfobacterales bacterium]